MARNEAMCPYCGEMINERATVCRYCGRTIRCGCDVHDSGTDGWRPVRSEDSRPGRSAAPNTGHSRPVTSHERSRPAPSSAPRRRNGSGCGIALAVIVIFIAILAAAFALLLGYARDHSDRFDEIISYLTDENGAGDADVPDGFDGLDDLDDSNSFSDELEAPIANIAGRYVGALTTDDREAMAELFIPEIRGYYDGETDQMLEDLDEWFENYGDEVDRMIPLGQNELSTDDLDEAAEALGVTFDRVVDAQIELLLKDGEEIDVDLILVEMDGSWYLYSTF